MENTILIQNLEDYLPLKHGGLNIYERYNSLFTLIKENIGEKYANFFARPIITYSAMQKIYNSSWMSNHIVKGTPFTSLSAQEQQNASVQLEEIVVKIKKFARHLSEQPGNEKKEMSEYILKALEIPDLSCIRVENNKIVSVLWGFQKEIKNKENIVLSVTQKNNGQNIKPEDNKPQNVSDDRLNIEKLLEDSKKNQNNQNNKNNQYNQDNQDNQNNLNRNNTQNTVIPQNNYPNHPPLTEYERLERTRKMRKAAIIGGGGILLIGLILLILFLAGVFMVIKQTGMVFNDEAYTKIATKPILAESEYSGLEANFSLKPYCPKPGNQGPYGTCVGWSSAYAARTISEAYKNAMKDQTEKITEMAYSAHYVYKLIKYSDDVSCSQGSQIDAAMEIMKNNGVPLLSDFNVQCANEIPAAIDTKAAENKIKNYSKLFDIGSDESIKVKTVKKAISEGNPVVIGMLCYSSFQSAKEVWNGKTSGTPGGHAMCVIGWDDSKYGGAFEIINSWGSDWGNEGYIWVTYKDFAINTKYAFEINGSGKHAEDEKATLEASIEFIAYEKEMPVKCLVKDNAPTVDITIFSHYQMLESYKSGTKYRINITIEQPAYVYVLGSDLTGVVNNLFPIDKSTSAYLSYTGSKITLPNDVDQIILDNTIGTDYACILVSNEELDIESIKTQMESVSGSFAKKLNTVLKDKMFEKSELKYESSKIKVEGFSSTKSVIPIIVEMEHL